jgi:aspartate aminotransferase
MNEFLNKNDSNKLKLLVLNYPGNPTGTTYSDEDLIALSEIFRKKNILVLSDEIYGLLHHNGLHTSISNYYPEGTFVSSGLSKWCGAGGWRLGYMCFPDEHIKVLNQVSALASETFSAVSSPIQYASVSAFNDSLSIHDYLFHVRRILKLLGKTCFNILDQDGINIIEPDGGFYLFPVFRLNNTALNFESSNEFCKLLLEKTGVASLPGSDFNRIQNEISCRLAYVNFNGTEALQVSKSVGKSKELTKDDLQYTCKDVWAGLNKLTEFL